MFFSVHMHFNVPMILGYSIADEDVDWA